MLFGVLIALRRAWRWAAVHPARTLAIASDWHGFPLLVRAPRFASSIYASIGFGTIWDHLRRLIRPFGCPKRRCHTINLADR